MKVPWAAVFLSAALLCPAATLRYMSVEEMAGKSTAIVRGRVGEPRVERVGALIYTFQRVEVSDQWKGAPVRSVEVALPGGSLDGVELSFEGVPELEPGREYILFLWRGPSGRVQITGLSQGVFEVRRSESPGPRVSRPPIEARMVDADGLPAAAVAAEELPLADLELSVRQALAGRPAAP